MECAVCLHDWSSTDCIPKMLSCGHSYCEGCLGLMFKAKLDKAGGAEITCPNCQAVHKFKDQAELKKLTKNFALISLASHQNLMVPLN
jgi:preprotein translocase subunit SecA